MEEELPSTSQIQDSENASSINHRTKRRSSGNCLEMQKKVFVNEKKANSSDDKKMKEVCDKTVRKLFMGSQKCFAMFDEPGKNPTDTNNNDKKNIEKPTSKSLYAFREAPDLRKCFCCYKIMIIPYACFLCKNSVCNECLEVCAKCGNSQCKICFRSVNNAGPLDIDVPLCRVCDI